MQAVRPGDVVIRRRYDPDKSAGYVEDAYLCLWVKHHMPAPAKYVDYDPEDWYVEFGGLELGRFNLVTEMIPRLEKVEFPWT